MKHTRGSLFLHNGEPCRLCYVHADTSTGTAIRLDAGKLEFFTVSFADLDEAKRPEVTPSNSVVEPKKKWITKAEANLAHIKPLLDLGPRLFDEAIREAEIERLTREGTSRCAKTLRALLLRYFQRGMTLYALIPDYANCGSTNVGLTNKRGRCDAYQITPDDLAAMSKAKDYWLTEDDNERRTIEGSHIWLLETSYTYLDGNGQTCLLPPSQRPSIHQFRRYLKREVSLEVRIRKRHGEKAWQRDAKPTLADTIRNCLGVGHIYEIDATIGDVLIVSKFDRLTIIGKATVYLIVDRRSRLIVGFYVGLDHACWETAVEAIVSLAEPKEAICRRYGVPYDPADWPADGFLPELFLGDNGELNSAFSTAIASRLNCEVANTESYLPIHKPNVETRFKLITIILRSRTPGYVPPENFGKRCTTSQEKEACLTLDEFVHEILVAIIQYNRTPILQGEVRDPGQILREVSPSPIELWNDGILHGGGCLGHEMASADVRLALLPRDQASITGEGIKFEGLAYSSEHPAIHAAIVKARVTERRAHVEVCHDRRSTDMIWVHRGEPSREVVPVFLTPKYQDYAGLSFKEVKTIKNKETSQKKTHREQGEQAEFDARKQSKGNILNAEGLRNDLGSTSIRSRTKRTKEQRAADRHSINREAAQAAREEPEMPEVRAGAAAPGGNVVGLPVGNRFKSRDPSAMTPAQKARLGVVSP